MYILNNFQIIQVKRRKDLNSTAQVDVNNRYSALAASNDEIALETQIENKFPKPPPIFVYGNERYGQMIIRLSEMIEKEPHIIKCFADNK